MEEELLLFGEHEADSLASREIESSSRRAMQGIEQDRHIRDDVQGPHLTASRAEGRAHSPMGSSASARSKAPNVSLARSLNQREMFGVDRLAQTASLRDENAITDYINSQTHADHREFLDDLRQRGHLKIRYAADIPQMPSSPEQYKIKKQLLMFLPDHQISFYKADLSPIRCFKYGADILGFRSPVTGDKPHICDFTEQIQNYPEFGGRGVVYQHSLSDALSLTPMDYVSER